MVARIIKHAGGFDVVQLDTANKWERSESEMRGQRAVRVLRQGRRAMSRDAQVLRWDGQGKINPEVFDVAAS
jgi:hypothetical protein